MKDNSAYTFRLRYAIAILIIYVIVSIPLYLHTMETLYINMIWNVFLALIPLFFAYLILRLSEKKALVLRIVFGVLWLAFLPNSPYMITDFIHISGNSFYLGNEEYSQLILSTNMTLWIRIVYLGIGVLIGILSGLLSMRMVHKVLSDRLDKISSWLILPIVFLLSGYGIYLGRFLRLNSWNLLHPHQLLAKIADSTTRFSIKFTLLYAFFVGAIYLIFYLLCPIAGLAPKDREEE